MINKIRKELLELKGIDIHITVNNIRNKKDEIDGKITELYNRIFIVKCKDNLNRSFNYSDILTGNLEIKCKKMYTKCK